MSTFIVIVSVLIIGIKYIALSEQIAHQSWTNPGQKKARQVSTNTNLGYLFFKIAFDSKFQQNSSSNSQQGNIFIISKNSEISMKTPAELSNKENICRRLRSYLCKTFCKTHNILLITSVKGKFLNIKTGSGWNCHLLSELIPTGSPGHSFNTRLEIE